MSLEDYVELEQGRKDAGQTLSSGHVGNNGLGHAGGTPIRTPIRTKKLPKMIPAKKRGVQVKFFNFKIFLVLRRTTRSSAAPGPPLPTVTRAPKASTRWLRAGCPHRPPRIKRLGAARCFLYHAAFGWERRACNQTGGLQFFISINASTQRHFSEPRMYIDGDPRQRSPHRYPHHNPIFRPTQLATQFQNCGLRFTF